MQYQYTIKGNIIQGPGIDDSAGYLAQLGLAVGSPVKYIFTINLSAPGFIKMSDGSIKPAPMPELGSFFAKYISGTTWTPATHINSYNGIMEMNYGRPGWQKLYPPFGERSLALSNGNNHLIFQDMLQQPDAKDRWPVGSNFGCAAMINTIFDASGKQSRFAFEAKITKVTLV